MTKSFFVLMIALLAGIANANAQKNEQKMVTLGIRAGVNFQKIYGDDFYGNKVDNDFKTGFHAGITADLMVTPTFYLQPGLLFSTKGAKGKNDNVEITQNISYIELPVNVLFKPELGSGRLLLGVGPYVAYGISGQYKTKTGSTTVESDAKFKNTITAADYLNGDFYFVKPFDFGANALVGYELNNGFSVQVNGQLGLSKINPKIENVTEVNKTDVKNVGVGLSVGYRF